MIKYLIFFLILILALENYTYIAIKTLSKSKIFYLTYLILSIGVFFFFLFTTFSLTSKDISDQKKASKITYLSLLIVVFYLPKIFICLPLILEDLYHFFFHFQKISSKERRKFISFLAFGAASTAFFSSIYGVIWGRFRYNLMKKELYFEEFPESFDNLKVIHISDIHCGSFYLRDQEKIKVGIDLILSQKPDLILFTGDLVNNKASEMENWIVLFSKLKAPLGVYASLGNHDYGDYIRWKNLDEKKKNFEELIEVYKKLGWKLLRNENHKISKNNQSIYLIGLENWGLAPFPKYGDLEKSTQSLEKENFKILLSHDPSHFDAEVKNFSKKIQLTLAGHTHGMQFGIEIPGFIKWSPVKYRYPKWAGLYEEKNRYLYVNRGFGYLAFPGRIGIWPEITLLTLKRKF